MARISLRALAAAGVAISTLAAAALAQPTFRPLAPPAARGLMLSVTPEATATPAQRGRIQTFRRTPGVGAVNVARLAPQALASAGVGQMLQLEVAPGVRFTARALAVEQLEGGRMLWRGEVAPGAPGRPPGLATFVINGDQITGSIHTPNGELYQVRPLGDGSTAIIRFDYATAPEDEPADFARSARSSMLTTPLAAGPGPSRATIAPQLRRAPPAAASPALVRPALAARLNLVERYRCLPCIYTALTPRIDVLVAYTQSAAAAAGDISSLINLAVAETNDSFTNSGVKAQLRLVGTMPVNYNDSSKSFGQMVAELAGTSDGFIDNVHAQRDALHADVVVMIINNGAYCGMADDIGAVPATAFVVVHYSCATGYYSFGHEIGHLLGARHDLPDDPTSTPFAYGHGFRRDVSSGGWRTIMSYRCTSGGCDPRLQYWSSPSLTHNGQAMGSASENNVAVWNARAATVAGFR